MTLTTTGSGGKSLMGNFVDSVLDEVEVDEMATATTPMTPMISLLDSDSPEWDSKSLGRHKNDDGIVDPEQYDAEILDVKNSSIADEEDSEDRDSAATF